MNNKPTVYMICGFIGSGKTTFAKELEKETGAIRITKDEWIIKIFGNTPIKDKFDEYDKKISELSTNFAFELVKHGMNVIIDDGFWIKSQREKMRNKIKALGAKTVLYYVTCPLNVMKQRVTHRSNNPPEDSFEISENMFDNYAKYWEPPENNEEYVLVDGQNIKGYMQKSAQQAHKV